MTHRPVPARTCLGVLLLVLGGAGWHCSTTAPAPPMHLEIQTHPWYQRAHHAQDGFRNIWEEALATSFLRTMGWVLGHAFQRKTNVPPPVVPVDAPALFRRPERLRITWIGHASAFIQTPTLDLLVDPMFGERASPYTFAGPKRETPLPFLLEDLTEVDVVLISHNHYDHLDEGSIRRLEETFKPLFLVPLGLAGTLRAWGARRVAELDWWQYVDFEGVRYHCTPARHFSSRGLLDRDETLWAGWYVDAGLGAGGLRLFFAGDTGYAPHFREVRERLGAPEVALIPIGAYLPRWFMAPVHVDPDEAVQAFLDVGARHFIPIHWGTFDLADEPLQEPPARLRALAETHGIADRVHLLDVGGRFMLDATPAAMSPAGRR